MVETLFTQDPGALRRWARARLLSRICLNGHQGAVQQHHSGKRIFFSTYQWQLHPLPGVVRPVFNGALDYRVSSCLSPLVMLRVLAGSYRSL